MSKKFHINTKPDCSWSENDFTLPNAIEEKIEWIFGDDEDLNARGITTNEIKESIQRALAPFFLAKKHKKNRPTIPKQKEDILKLSETLNELLARLSNLPPTYKAGLKSTLLVDFKKTGFLNKIKDDLCLLQSAIECTEMTFQTTQKKPERDILIYRLANIFEHYGEKSKIFGEKDGKGLAIKADFIRCVLSEIGEKVPKDKIRMVTRVNSLKMSDYF